MGGIPPEDMWKVLGRELWNPWPQVDVMVHTGSQVRALQHDMLSTQSSLNVDAEVQRMCLYIIREEYPVINATRNKEGAT